MSNRNPFDYYGLWEQINNENFNSVEFHVIKTEEVPYNRFTMTPKKWKEKFKISNLQFESEMCYEICSIIKRNKYKWQK